MVTIKSNLTNINNTILNSSVSTNSIVSFSTFPSCLNSNSFTNNNLITKQYVDKLYSFNIDLNVLTPLIMAGDDSVAFINGVPEGGMYRYYNNILIRTVPDANFNKMVKDVFLISYKGILQSTCVGLTNNSSQFYYCKIGYTNICLVKGNNASWCIPLTNADWLTNNSSIVLNVTLNDTASNIDIILDDPLTYWTGLNNNIESYMTPTITPNNINTPAISISFINKTITFYSPIKWMYNNAYM